MGAAGELFLLKVVSPEPPPLDQYPETVQAHIKNAVARPGMSKAAVYTAMGPPAWIPAGNTHVRSYETIMAANLWVYKRRRFGKNIGVEFDPQTGNVIRTEGIWR